MGLDIYLQRNGKNVEQPSTLDANHLFQRGYFRSSYNESGFNRVMEVAGCPTLYDIFQAPQNADKFKPNWHESLKRAVAALQQYREYLASPAGGHYVTFASATSFVSSGQEAMQVFVKTATREQPFSAYSNKDGHFWMNGATVKAAIPGKNLFGPGMYLVMEKQRDGERDWYETALLILNETLEYVVASGSVDEFSLYWSA